MGWTSDNAHVLLSDGWDIWKVPAAAGQPAVNLTVVGKKDKIRHRTRVVTDPRERGADMTKRQVFSVFEEMTKKSGYGALEPGTTGLKRLILEDAQIFNLQKAEKADVVVENFRPGVMDRLGLGWDRLSTENPRVVYASLSGFGADGPHRDRGAFDLTIQAEGGYMSITGDRGGAPIKLGTSAFDLIAGLYAKGAIVTALLTAIYMFRLVFLTFHGERRTVDHAAPHAAFFFRNAISYHVAPRIWTFRIQS